MFALLGGRADNVMALLIKPGQFDCAVNIFYNAKKE
jgi:hypothetical protein